MTINKRQASHLIGGFRRVAPRRPQMAAAVTSLSFPFLSPPPAAFSTSIARISVLSIYLFIYLSIHVFIQRTQGDYGRVELLYLLSINSFPCWFYNCLYQAGNAGLIDSICLVQYSRQIIIRPADYIRSHNPAISPSTTRN